MKLDINFDTSVPDYAMFTDLGNAAVHAIVTKARAEKMTWAQTYRALHNLAEQDQFGEATDTAVREVVYDAIDAANRDESFWV